MKHQIPTDKFDIETADKLMQYSYDQIKPIIPELLTWIQDLHWPVSEPIANYLRTISENLSDNIIEIMEGTDEEWKWSCIQVFAISADKMPETAVVEEIRRIANNPTKGEIKEEVQEVAIEFINGLEKNAP